MRAIIDEVITELEYSSGEYEIVHDEFVDKPAIERIELVNKLYAEDKRCMYVSIHSDRMPHGSRGRHYSCLLVKNLLANEVHRSQTLVFQTKDNGIIVFNIGL